ncbi:MAG: ACP S-malonyltransferase [Spirochaetaceae bacterium]|jgi:[acyl-carrier-protein] S-malonyltransferase|nr:ACP S-malonyltransferase [Spirochaetaceae bacterium]
MVENSNTAFVFPGQGAQFTGMAMDFYENSARVRELFSCASESTGRDMKKLLSEGGCEELKRTDNAQLAVTLANLAAAQALSEHGINAAAAAGHSLGEYAALVVAGVISKEDCFRLVKTRGELMLEAAAMCEEGSGMAAVMGLEGTAVRELIEQWSGDGLCGLYAANFNSPRQTVISGTKSALSEAERRFTEAGARRVIRLRVSGPFHSPLIEEAARRFSPELEKAVFAAPAIPFFSNVTGGRVRDAAEIKALSLAQITAPVRWLDEEQAIAALAGVNRIFEAGPGTVLTGLWRDFRAVNTEAPECFAAGSIESQAQALQTGD